jgi:DNA repair exonuclease SbcCD nuclease subunit
MVLLCVGDVHIKPTNTHLIDALESQLLEIVERERVQVIILLGDILDTFEKIHTQALNRAYALIDTLRQHSRVYLLVGNHDLINNQQFLSTHHWMNALKDWRDVTVVDTVHDAHISHPLLPYRIVLVPYVPVQRFQDALDTLDNNWRTAEYIFAHQEFQGSKMGAIQSAHGDPWPVDAPMVISGHIHDYQRPQENILYIGASVQNNFGDQTDPRVLCIHGPQRQWTEIPLRLPKKKTVYSTLEDVQTLDTTQYVDDPNIDTVRIVVRGDYEQFKTFLKSKQYETLAASAKCKIVHKPVTHATDSAITTEDLSALEQNPAAQGTFEERLTRHVLERRDEQLYTALRHVAYGDTSCRAEDLLIV